MALQLGRRRVVEGDLGVIGQCDSRVPADGRGARQRTGSLTRSIVCQQDQVGCTGCEVRHDVMRRAPEDEALVEQEQVVAATAGQSRIAAGPLKGVITCAGFD